MDKHIGVLALQGAFARHIKVLSALGIPAHEVRTRTDLDAVDALVIPGGESTTVGKLLDTFELFDPIAKRIADGMAVFGTCAGMILLARDVADGRPDQRTFAAIDIDVRRNAYGRQVDSFETDLDVKGFERPFHAVFIRAPRVERWGRSVEVLAVVDDAPVLCREDRVWVAAFHPELTDDVRIHQAFLQEL